MNVLDLFAGIGGFSLGLERAGFKTAAFCEIDPYCQKVLRKHWPDVPIYDDITKLDGSELDDIGLICGGYPCQGESLAGKRGGEKDDRWLWPEMYRIIKAVRPRWVIAENVAGHISMGLDTVLSDLEAANYVWWTFVIPACAVDAKHRRDRVWILATDTEHLRSTEQQRQYQGAEKPNGSCTDKLDARNDVANAKIINAGGLSIRKDEKEPRPSCGGQNVSDTKEQQSRGLFKREFQADVGSSSDRREAASCWPTEPNVGQLVDGLSAGLARIRGLINDQRWVQIPCEKDAEKCLRELRKHKTTLRAPQGQELGKQRSIEFDDAVQFLSHIITSCSGRDNAKGGEKVLLALRENILSSGFMQHASDKIETVWQSLTDAEADWFILATCLGRDWTSIPIGRVAKNVPRRVDRLRSLGNAVIPQIPEIIGRAILHDPRT